MASRLTYTDSNHSYTLDGDKVPSVTTCLGALNKPGLVPWAAHLGATWVRDNPRLVADLSAADWEKEAKAQPNRARDAAGSIGTELHAYAEKLATTGEAPDVPAEALPLVLQAADFLDTMDVETIASERAVFHDTYLYAGRFDLIATIRGKVWLLDFKTSKSGVYPEMALQQAAYRYATHMQAADPSADDEPMMPVSSAGIVWVRPDGWQLVPVRADKDAWLAFLATLPIYRFSRMRRAETVGAAVAVGSAHE